MTKQTYAELAREEGRNYISLGGGLAEHWVCTHCEGWSPGEWGEGTKAVQHKPDCPLAAE